MKKFFIVSALVAASFSNGNAQSLTSGLVGWWPMNGNAKDSSGNSNDGVVGGAKLTTDSFGMANKAYQFSAGTYIDCGNKTSLKRFNTDFTISAWVYLDKYPSGFFPDYSSTVLSNRGANNSGSLFAIDNGGKFELTVLGGPSARRVSSKTQVPLSSWCHLTVTFKYNGSTGNVGKAYLNGVLDQTNDSMPAMITPDTNRTSLGKEVSNGNTKYYLNGKLDDVRIYNRELSASEVAALASFKTTGIGSAAELEPAFFDVSPNPANNGRFTLTLKEKGKLKINIRDITGRTVYTSDIENKADIDLSGNTKGIYLVFASKDGKQSIGKIIVE